MSPGQLFANVSYVDVALLLIIFCSCLVTIQLHRKAARKIEAMKKEIAVLKKYQTDLYENVESKSESLKAALKEVLFDKTNKLSVRLKELSQNLDDMRERNEAMLEEIEGKVKPLKAFLNESLAKVRASQDTMRNMISESTEEVKKMANHINAFSKEIKKMKDSIRERTIDLEL